MCHNSEDNGLKKLTLEQIAEDTKKHSRSNPSGMIQNNLNLKYKNFCGSKIPIPFPLVLKYS